jgi:hypothetical protein
MIAKTPVSLLHHSTINPNIVMSAPTRRMTNPTSLLLSGISNALQRGILLTQVTTMGCGRGRRSPSDARPLESTLAAYRPRQPRPDDGCRKTATAGVGAFQTPIPPTAGVVSGNRRATRVIRNHKILGLPQ